MRKSILLLLVALVAGFALACSPTNNANGGGGDKDKCGAKCGTKCGGAKADMWGIYKKEGASWTLKNTTKVPDQPDMVTYTKMEITKVAADHAIQTTTTLDKDKKEMAGMKPMEMKIEFKAPEAPKDKAPEPPKAEEKKVKVEAGEFDCISYDGKTWSMKKYPQVTVKSEMSELVEFKEGK